MTKTLVLPLLVCGLITAAPQRSTAGVDPLAKCASAKLKAASKKAAGKLKCLSKNAVKPDPVALDACNSKVELKFAPAFTKADAASPCAGRPEDVEISVDSCVQHLSDAIPGMTGVEKCTGAKLGAVSKAAGGELGCYSKAVLKAIAVDPLCLGKATTGVTTTFGKADVSGPCPGDPAIANSEIDSSCVQPVKGQLPAKAPGCGNGVVEAYLGETCDDGNAKDGDSCPASCHIDDCTAVPASSVGIHVTYSGPAGTTVSGLGFFVDYPEGKVTTPTTTPPFGVSADVNKLGYGFSVQALKIGGLPSPMLSATFQTCQGAGAVTASDFSCTVTDAADDNGDVIPAGQVTCTVTVP